ncbi:MAG TPA: hypothetical protein VM532_05160 [Burkholderiales bacterium]|nr:hypothetical protein [Burkholderiales bacterium]
MNDQKDGKELPMLPEDSNEALMSKLDAALTAIKWFKEPNELLSEGKPNPALELADLELLKVTIVARKRNLLDAINEAIPLMSTVIADADVLIEEVESSINAKNERVSASDFPAPPLRSTAVDQADGSNLDLQAPPSSAAIDRALALQELTFAISGFDPELEKGDAQQIIERYKTMLPLQDGEELQIFDSIKAIDSNKHGLLFTHINKIIKQDPVHKSAAESFLTTLRNVIATLRPTSLSTQDPTPQPSSQLDSQRKTTGGFSLFPATSSKPRVKPTASDKAKEKYEAQKKRAESMQKLTEAITHYNANFHDHAVFQENTAAIFNAYKEVHPANPEETLSIKSHIENLDINPLARLMSRLRTLGEDGSVDIEPLKNMLQSALEKLMAKKGPEVNEGSERGQSEASTQELDDIEAMLHAPGDLTMPNSSLTSLKGKEVKEEQAGQQSDLSPETEMDHLHEALKAARFSTSELPDYPMSPQDALSSDHGALSTTNKTTEEEITPQAVFSDESSTIPTLSMGDVKAAINIYALDNSEDHVDRIIEKVKASSGVAQDDISNYTSKTLDDLSLARLLVTVNMRLGKAISNNDPVNRLSAALQSDLEQRITGKRAETKVHKSRLPVPTAKLKQAQDTATSEDISLNDYFSSAQNSLKAYGIENKLHELSQSGPISDDLLSDKALTQALSLLEKNTYRKGTLLADENQETIEGLRAERERRIGVGLPLRGALLDVAVEQWPNEAGRKEAQKILKVFEALKPLHQLQTNTTPRDATPDKARQNRLVDLLMEKALIEEVNTATIGAERASARSVLARFYQTSTPDHARKDMANFLDQGPIDAARTTEAQARCMAHAGWLVKQESLPFITSLTPSRSKSGMSSMFSRLKPKTIEGHEWSGQRFIGTVTDVKRDEYGYLKAIEVTEASGDKHILSADRMKFSANSDPDNEPKQGRTYAFHLARAFDRMSEEELNKHCEVITASDRVKRMGKRNAKAAGDVAAAFPNAETSDTTIMIELPGGATNKKVPMLKLTQQEHKLDNVRVGTRITDPIDLAGGKTQAPEAPQMGGSSKSRWR